jgi:hypothetical protein
VLPLALERYAEDPLGQPETIHRRGIDQIDALIESGMNGGYRSGYVNVFATSEGPGTERHPGDSELRLGNIHEFSFSGRDSGLN